MFRLISLLIRMSEGINLLSELLVETDKLIRSSQVEADSLHAKSSIIPPLPHPTMCSTQDLPEICTNRDISTRVTPSLRSLTKSTSSCNDHKGWVLTARMNHRTWSYIPDHTVTITRSFMDREETVHQESEMHYGP